MRENMGVYRGKRKDNGEWVEGHFFTQVYAPETIEEDWYCFIKPIGSETLESYRVDPDTVGECSGVPDKNGKRIFEGDIVTFKTRVGSFKPHYVRWYKEDARFIVTGKDGVRSYPMDRSFEYEVIGNIHDNPELLEGTQK